MGLLSRSLFHSRGAAVGTEWKSTDQTLELFKEIFGTNAANTGDNVNWKTALQVSTVLACARVIMNGISQVPFKVMQESIDGKTRLPARAHKLYRVLHRRPNPLQTSFEFRQTMALHLALNWNFYAFKNVVNGRVVELIPLEPNCMEAKRLSGGDMQYFFTAPLGGGRQEIPAESIWHVRGPSWNGWAGMDAMKLAREAIGLAMATERQHAKLHANGAHTTGVYSVEGTLNENQYKDIRKFILENHTGASAGLPMILDRGAKWMQQAMNGVDSQHLETRKFQVEEVCRNMGVLPIMVGYSDKAATYASAEQMFIAHVVHTLAPWYECIEQSADVNLLSEKDEADGFYTKFIAEGLMRGSMQATAEMIDKYVNGGVMTPNEGRAKLDLNPDPDPASDKLRVPQNIVGKPADPKKPEPVPTP